MRECCGRGAFIPESQLSILPPFHSRILHRYGALGVELSADLLRAGRTGVPLVCCEVCTHNSQPFSSYDFGRPSPDGLEHAPRRPCTWMGACVCEVCTRVACHARLLICPGLSVGIMKASFRPLDCPWADAQLEHSTPAGPHCSRTGAGVRHGDHGSHENGAQHSTARGFAPPFLG